jgi:hypothetical protein
VKSGSCYLHTHVLGIGSATLTAIVSAAVIQDVEQMQGKKRSAVAWAAQHFPLADRTSNRNTQPGSTAGEKTKAPQTPIEVIGRLRAVLPRKLLTTTLHCGPRCGNGSNGLLWKMRKPFEALSRTTVDCRKKSQSARSLRVAVVAFVISVSFFASPSSSASSSFLVWVLVAGEHRQFLWTLRNFPFPRAVTQITDASAQFR